MQSENFLDASKKEASCISNFPVEFLRPTSREAVLNLTAEPYSLEAATKLEMLMKYYAEQMHKSIQKVGGEAFDMMEKVLRVFGVADGLANEVNVSVAGRLLPTALESFSVISPQMFSLRETGGNVRKIVAMGDSTDGILLANLLHAKLTNADVDWLVVREYLGYEETKRNYAFHAELAYSLEPNNVLNVNPNDQLISKTIHHLRLFYPNGVHVLFLNATGSEVLENNASFDMYETVNRALNWLQIGESTSHYIMKPGGNMVIRVNLTVLARSDTVFAICQILKLFKVAKLVAPALGVDKGIIYLVLEDFVDTQRERKLPSINNDHSFLNKEVYGFLFFLAPFMQESVISFILSLDSLIGMLNLPKGIKEIVGNKLKLLRDEDPSYKPQPFEALKQTTASFFNENRGKLFFLLNRRVTPSACLADIYPVLRKSKDSRKDALWALNVLWRSRQSAVQDNRFPPFYKLGQTLLLDGSFENMEENYDQDYNVVWGSRWCLSSLVPIRGAFKSILMDTHTNLNLNEQVLNCQLCKSWKKKELLGILEDKLAGGLNPPADVAIKRKFIENKNSFVRDCFLEDLNSLAKKSDLESAYQRAETMMNILEKLPNYGSIFICSYPLLSRIDVGVVFLLSSLFANTYLVGCNLKPPVFGIFFHDLLTVGDPRGKKKKTVISHVRKAVSYGMSEVAEFEDLDAFFDSCNYLEQWNTHMLSNCLQMLWESYRATEESLEKAMK